MKTLRLVTYLLVAILAVACSHSDSSPAGRAFSVPSDVNLSVAPSQLLSSAEYGQFLNFLSTVNNLTRFAPQNFAFGPVLPPDLTPDQVSEVNQVKNNCMISDDPGQSSKNNGTVLSQTDTRSISGPKCLLNYSRKYANNMTIEKFNRLDQSFGADGGISINETLSVQMNNATDNFWTDMAMIGSSNKTAVTYAFQSPGTAGDQLPSDDRLYIHYATDKLINGFPSSNGYTLSATADILFSKSNYQGQNAYKVAMNLAVVPYGMSKTVVLSIVAVSDGNPSYNTPQVTLLVNGVSVSGNDQNTIMSNGFIANQIADAMGSFQNLSMFAVPGDSPMNSSIYHRIVTKFHK